MGRAVTVIAPYVVGEFEGVYVGEQTSVERWGTADAVLRFGVNLFGAPAMDREAFGSYRSPTRIGGDFTSIGVSYSYTWM